MFLFTLEGVLAKGACTPVEAQGKNCSYVMNVLVLEEGQAVKPELTIS